MLAKVHTWDTGCWEATEVTACSWLAGRALPKAGDRRPMRPAINIAAAVGADVVGGGLGDVVRLGVPCRPGGREHGTVAGSPCVDCVAVTVAVNGLAYRAGWSAGQGGELSGLQVAGVVAGRPSLAGEQPGRRLGASCQGRAGQAGWAEMIIWPGS